MSRSSNKPALIAGVAVLAFAWGTLSARREMFPFPLLQSAWRAVTGSPQGTGPDHPDGLWRPVRILDNQGPEGLEELANLPYLRGKTSTPDASGITSYDPDAAQDGYNLIVSAHAPEASLVDMSGNVLHTWTKPFGEVWTEPLDFIERPEHQQFWRRVHLDSDGDLLAIFDGIGMIKLDRDSKVLWKNEGRYHSDVFVTPGGTIYTLARQQRDEHDRLELTAPILEDFVVEVGADGSETARVSLIDCLLDSDHAPLVPHSPKGGNPLRANSIQVLSSQQSAAHPLWREGHVLVSLGALDTVAVVDLDQKKVVWALTGLFAGQNDATVLDNGRLLVFDNKGNHGRSRLVEIDPVAERVVWACPESGSSLLHSAILGSAQRLANGNTLITETEGGRAFEVTPDQKIAWEYLNPHTGNDGDLIACLCEVVRLDRASVDAGFLGGGESGEKIDTSGVRELLQKKK